MACGRTSGRPWPPWWRRCGELQAPGALVGPTAVRDGPRIGCGNPAVGRWGNTAGPFGRRTGPAPPSWTSVYPIPPATWARPVRGAGGAASEPPTPVQPERSFNGRRRASAPEASQRCGRPGCTSPAPGGRQARTTPDRSGLRAWTGGVVHHRNLLPPLGLLARPPPGLGDRDHMTGPLSRVQTDPVDAGSLLSASSSGWPEPGSADAQHLDR